MAKKQEVAPQTQASRNVYQQFKAETSSSNIEGDLLRFTKQGDWVAGADQDEIPEGTEVIVGVNTIKTGWQKWQDQQPVDFKMGLLSEGFRPPLREELGDSDEDEWDEYDGEKRDPWQQTTQCLMLNVKTKDVYTFSTSSKSGKTALGEVAGTYGDRLQDGGDEEEMPVVKLMSDSYKHKVYGKIMIPVFEQTGKWVKPPAPKDDAKKPAKGAAKGGKSAAAPSTSGKLNTPKALAPPRGANKNGSGKGARI